MSILLLEEKYEQITFSSLIVLIVVKHSLILGNSWILRVISFNSTLKPRIFTWLSILPMKSILPSVRHFAKSPVLYKVPCPKGLSINFSVVNLGLFKYPLLTPSPPTSNSPETPTGNKFKVGDTM